LCVLPHTRAKALISLKVSFSANSYSLVVKVVFEKGRFFSNAHTLSDDIFLFFLTPTTPTQRRDIYSESITESVDESERATLATKE
jgi:hypothetical protein